MSDVDVSAVGVFMLLSYSELRGLLVLVSPPPPPPSRWCLGLHSQSLHINGHEHITTLHYYNITQFSKHAGGM